MSTPDLKEGAAKASFFSNSLSKEEKIQLIQEHFSKIMEVLGLDLSDPSLAKTPYRIAKMYVEELFYGLDPNNFPSMSFFEENLHEDMGKMVLVKEIKVHSMCEHHFVPFVGKAVVAYIPHKKILGLSKINRIVDYFCRRPQLQERLTVQIADSLASLLETDDLAVRIEAKHFCVALRGIKDICSIADTHVMRGCFKIDILLRQEFFSSFSNNT